MGGRAAARDVGIMPGSPSPPRPPSGGPPQRGPGPSSRRGPPDEIPARAPPGAPAGPRPPTAPCPLSSPSAAGVQGLELAKGNQQRFMGLKSDPLLHKHREVVYHASANELVSGPAPPAAGDPPGRAGGRAPPPPPAARMTVSLHRPPSGPTSPEAMRASNFSLSH